LHNTRVFDVLELERDVIGIGTKRVDFLDVAYARGEFSTDILAEHKRRLSAYVSFQFDRTLPSGRVVATYARPTREADMSRRPRMSPKHTKLRLIWPWPNKPQKAPKRRRVKSC
jgi:hypothetical protein